MFGSWKTPAGAAVLGFAVATVFYVQAVHDFYSAPSGSWDWLVVPANIILCPPTFLFGWCVDCEFPQPPPTLRLDLITVGLLNATLYAAVALVLQVRSRRKRQPAQANASARFPLPL